jgi:hypothetical protein
VSLVRVSLRAVRFFNAVEEAARTPLCREEHVELRCRCVRACMCVYTVKRLPVALHARG